MYGKSLDNRWQIVGSCADDLPTIWPRIGRVILPEVIGKDWSLACPGWSPAAGSRELATDLPSTLIRIRRDKQQQNHEKEWPEDEEWSRKSSDCKWDGSMWGLDGPKSGNVEEELAFKAVVQGSSRT